MHRGYADLTMIVRRDMRQFALLDHLIEFKFVSLKGAGLSGSEGQEHSLEALWELPAGGLADIYADDLRFHEYVAIGFERILWAELTPNRQYLEHSSPNSVNCRLYGA